MKETKTDENVISKVLNHHLSAFGSNDLDEIMKDYDPQSEILTPNGPLKELAYFKRFFKSILRLYRQVQYSS